MIDKMINERRIKKTVDVSNVSLILSTITEFAWRDWGNT
jgi:hypothetical protein